LLLVAIALLSSQQVHPNPPPSDVETAREEGMREGIMEATNLLDVERSVQICRELSAVGNWAEVIVKRAEEDPTIGQATRLIEGCMFYMHGRIDQAEDENRRDEAILRN
jgi:hypothetical protein